MRLTYPQAAAHLGLKVGTLRAMVCQEKVPHIRLGPRLVVFDREALDLWLAERSVQPRKAG
jgi:excisionase family DNA binding protein